MYNNKKYSKLQFIYYVKFKKYIFNILCTNNSILQILHCKIKIYNLKRI